MALVLFALMMLCSLCAWAQPTGGTACWTSAAAAASVSVNCSAAGSNRWVALGLSLYPKTNTVSTISYGAGTPTQIALIEHPTDSHELRLYGMVGPATGTQAVSVVPNAATDLFLTVLPMEGVHQTVTLGTAATGSTTNNPTYSVNVSSAATERVIDVASCFAVSGFGFTPGAGQSEHLDTDFGDIGTAMEMSSEVGAATTTMSGTYGNPVDGCLVAAVPVKPAAAAAATRRVGPMVMP